jgi:hypothetical protein
VSRHGPVLDIEGEWHHLRFHDDDTPTPHHLTRSPSRLAMMRA